MKKFRLDFAITAFKVQLKQPIGFRNSEYMMDTVVSMTAFALSFFPLGFFFVHAKKKSSITIDMK